MDSGGGPSLWWCQPTTESFILLYWREIIRNEKSLTKIIYRGSEIRTGSESKLRVEVQRERLMKKVMEKIKLSDDHTCHEFASIELKSVPSRNLIFNQII